MRKLGWIMALALVGGCEAEVEPQADTDAGGPPMMGEGPDAGPPQLDCTAAAGDGLMVCDDFGDGDAQGWEPEAGTWEVIANRYVGIGPMEVGTSSCGASLMSASLRDDSRRRDAAIHVAMTSRRRVDKVIVLRAVDDANRLEINLRADPYGDLVVQELVDCEVVRHVDEGEVEVPHAMDQTIEVDAELIGSHLTVAVDGRTVLDRELEMMTQDPGRQGIAIIDRSETVFDDVWIYERSR